MGGIGMLAVGILGTPFIGYLQETTATHVLQAKDPAIYQTVTAKKSWLLSPVFGDYTAIDPDKKAAVQTADGKDALKAAEVAGQFSALGKMAMFPGFMLCCYLILIFYFKSKGGYKPVQIESAGPQSTTSPETAAAK
jgi:hypothetical protein